MTPSPAPAPRLVTSARTGWWEAGEAAEVVLWVTGPPAPQQELWQSEKAVVLPRKGEAAAAEGETLGGRVLGRTRGLLA